MAPDQLESFEKGSDLGVGLGTGLPGVYFPNEPRQREDSPTVAGATGVETRGLLRDRESGRCN